MIALFMLISFIIGSIPVGLLLAKGKGIDLRSIGSGNIGATNVMRAMGKEAAIVTLAADMAKGAIAVGIGKALFHSGFSASDVLLTVISSSQLNMLTVVEGALGISAILGHDFSLFLRFKGGKGVATSLGVLMVLSPYTALFTITMWLITAKRTRYSSLSALTAFGLLPLSIFMIDYSKEKMIIAAVIAILIFIRHLENIKRLVQGTEGKIGGKR